MNVVLSNAVEEEKATGRANPIGMVVRIIACPLFALFTTGILTILFLQTIRGNSILQLELVG